jgi:phenylpropionate dioxygenase-like ring-hydroxylating dioxygenase large terminal subunit
MPDSCTFSESDWRILANYWHPVALSDDVKDKPVSATLLDQKLVVYRTPQGITVANDVCLHRGVPLSLGWIAGDELVCAYHGFRYDRTGQCVGIPAHPGAAIPPKLCLQTYPVAEKLGLIWTCLSGSPANELPDLSEWDDPDYQHVNPPVVEMAASAGRQVEGFLDVAHLPWIHHRTFADRSRPVVPAYEVERTSTGLHMEYQSPVGGYLRQDGGDVDPAGSALRVWDVYLPFAAKLKAFNAGGANPIVLNVASPASARRVRLFTALLRNYDQDQPVQPYIDFNLKIFNEDREIVERQCPEDLPLNLLDEVHIRADRTSILYRQELQRLGLGRSFTA